MPRLRFLLPAALLLLLMGCSTDHYLTLTSHEGDKHVQVTVTVADTPETRDEGMRGWKALAAGQAMLFVYPQPQIIKLDVEDMPFAVSVLFFDGKGDFISGEDELKPCHVEPCTVYKSPELAQYALMVAPKFRPDNSITLGWSMDVNKARRLSNPK